MNDHRRGNGIGAYRSCLALLLILVLAVPTTASDMIFRANPQHTGIFDNGGIAPTNNELWRFATGSRVRSSPAVSNGVVYVGSLDNNLYAIDAVTGKEKWRFATGGYVYSSPAVANGIVYVGGFDDKNLYAIGGVPSTQITTPTVTPTPTPTPTTVPTTPITTSPTPSITTILTTQPTIVITTTFQTTVLTTATTAPIVTTYTTPIPTRSPTPKVTFKTFTPYPTDTPTQPSPLGVEMGIIAIIGAALLVIKRK